MSTTPERELAHRTAGGLEVSLLWRPADGTVAVAVADSRTGDAFEIPVPPHHRPLDVFHHPFAYASSRAVRTVGRTGAAVAS